jgi:tRNA (cmo5U34)-methyltransferase
MDIVPKIEANPDGASSSLGHIPAGRWVFDDSVTQVFEDMLRRSIPQYEVMRRAVFDVGCRFVQPGTDIVDLGCSRGEAVAPFVARYGTENRYVGVEVSPPMLEACRRRFHDLAARGVVRLLDLDLRRAYPQVQASVTLAVLTLQFTPIEYRQRIVLDVWKHLVPNGAFIVVEKILGATADLDALMVDRYHQMKRESGYTQEEIDRKRYALEGVLVPMTAKWNEELLAQAGFAQVDCFWRWMNFAAWVAVKS